MTASANLEEAVKQYLIYDDETSNLTKTKKEIDGHKKILSTEIIDVLQQIDRKAVRVLTHPTGPKELNLHTRFKKPPFNKARLSEILEKKKGQTVDEDLTVSILSDMMDHGEKEPIFCLKVKKVKV